MRPFFCTVEQSVPISVLAKASSYESLALIPTLFVNAHSIRVPAQMYCTAWMALSIGISSLRALSSPELQANIVRAPASSSPFALGCVKERDLLPDRAIIWRKIIGFSTATGDSYFVEGEASVEPRLVITRTISVIPSGASRWIITKRCPSGEIS